MDSLTSQIVQTVDNLPITKKKAILELLKIEFKTDAKQIESFHERWKKELLTTSVWTDAEVNEIHEARRLINQWTPLQLS